MHPDEIIALFGMQQHPEGGHYVETFRDAGDGADDRASAIYFLLRAGEVSAWHRVRNAPELWHFYMGAALELSVASPDEPIRSVILGTDLAGGERPQAMVPADHWQTARSLGDWTLVGCTVAPGFAFSAFELAPPGFQPDGLR